MALALAMVMALLVPAVPAGAVSQVTWSGSFTGAYATNPSPVLTSSTTVSFGVSRTLDDSTTSGAQILVFDEAGTQLTWCYAGTSCEVSSNPAPGSSRSYYAELWVVSGGAYVHHSTSSTVTVTDPGWTGSFTSASASNSTPAMSDSAYVNFQVSAPLSSAQILVFDEAGTQLTWCYAGTSCAVSSNPALGTSLSYYAELWVTRAGAQVKYATSPTVTVTDPGWTGTFLPPADSYVRLDAGQMRGIGFGWDEPLGGASVRIKSSDGEVVATCSGVDYTGCTTNVWVGAGQLRSYWAEVYIQRPGGTELVMGTSSAIVVTTLDEEQLADLLIDGTDAQLTAFLGPVATPTTIAALRTVVTAVAADEALCLTIGALDPTHAGGSTATTTQQACAISTEAVLASLLVNLGVVAATAALTEYAVAHPPAPPTTNPNPPPNPDPTPPPNPDPGGSGTGGGSGGGSGGSSYFCEVEDAAGNQYKLSYNELAHIIDDHTGEVTPGKSAWNRSWYPTEADEEPGDILGAKLCGALQGPPLATRESASNPEHTQLLFTSADYVGTVGSTSAETKFFVIAVRPDGTVASAFPDLNWFG